MQQKNLEKYLTPINRTTTAYWVTLFILLAGVAVWLYTWSIQLTQGLIVTGMRDIGTMGGSPWGLYISNFIFFIAISHAAIAISAAVRIARLPEGT